MQKIMQHPKDPTPDSLGERKKKKATEPHPRVRKAYWNFIES